MAETNGNESPNEVLAQIVTNKLLEGKIIAVKKQVEVLGGLKTGSISAEDWKLWLEFSVHQAEAQDED